MAKAERFVPSSGEPGNELPTERLFLNQTAAALVALLNGAEQVPPIRQLRSMVRRNMARAQRARATGGRHHG
jgi:hypothetical protein